MLPRLQAEEALGRVEATALGTGSYQKQDAQRALDRLRRQVGAGKTATKAAPQPALLAAMGIAVQVVTPKPTAETEEATDG